MLKRTLLFALLLAGCNSVSETAGPGASSPSPRPFADNAVRVNDASRTVVVDRVQVAAGRLIVAVEDEITEAELDALGDALAREGAEIVGQAPASYLLEVELPAGSDLEAARARLQALSGVESVGYNETVTYDQQPAARNPDPATFAGDYWVAQTRAPNAWGFLNLAGTFPLVAVVDGGLNLSRGTFDASRVVTQVDSAGTPLGVTDSDGKDEHGTIVLAFAAGDGSGATSNKAVGTSWKSPAVVVKAFGDGFEGRKGFVFDGAAGIETALRRGARFVNVSIGTTLNSASSEQDFYRARESFREEFTNSLELAAQLDAVVCFSAGNDGDGTTESGPTNFRPKQDDRFLPPTSKRSDRPWRTHALIVGASLRNTMAEFSREGAIVSLAAPGEQVGFGKAAGGELLHNGTSYSTPLVMGSLAALLNVNPDLMAVEARQIVLDTLQGGLTSRSGTLRQLDFGAAAAQASSLKGVARATPLAVDLRAGQTSVSNVTLTAGTQTGVLSLVTLGDAEQFATVAPANFTNVPAGETRTFQVTLARSQEASGRQRTYPFMLWGKGDGSVLLRQPVQVTVLKDG